MCIDLWSSFNGTNKCYAQCVDENYLEFSCKNDANHRLLLMLPKHRTPAREFECAGRRCLCMDGEKTLIDKLYMLWWTDDISKTHFSSDLFRILLVVLRSTFVGMQAMLALTLYCYHSRYLVGEWCCRRQCVRTQKSATNALCVW